MQTHLKEAAGVWDSDSGEFISADHQRLAQVLKDYSPYLSLVWIPQKDRDATDTKPYAILSEMPGKPAHIIRYLTEQEMRDTQGILAWVFEGDVTKHRPNDILSRIESRDRAAQILELKRRQEEAEDQEDFVQFAVSNRSGNYWKHNGRSFRK